MAMSLSEAQAKRDLWQAACDAIARRQSFKHPDGTELTAVDSDKAHKALAYWQRVVNRLTNQAAGGDGRGVAIATWS